MYQIKRPGIIVFLYGDNKRIAEQIGISNRTLSRILNGKDTTKYSTAYCITKIFDSSKEVNDFFNKID